MVPQELPVFSPGQIEVAARKLLKNFLGDNPYHPIDVEAILESIPGVILDIFPGLRSRFSVEGFVCKELNSGHWLVFADADIASNETHYRMVIAEELGHICLHKELIGGITSVNDFFAIQQHKDWARMENDARAMGRAILMPMDNILQEADAAYSTLVDRVGFGDSNAVTKYVRNMLAKTFSTRPIDMDRRLHRSPSDIYDRIKASVLARSPELLSSTCLPRVNARKLSNGQKKLFDDLYEDLPTTEGV